MHWWYTNGWWGGWVMMISMILFWVLVIVGIVILIRWLATRTPGVFPGAPAGGPSAIEILKQRYALGEITREQFQQMRRDLEEDAKPTG